jgi:hypothetical protein
MKTLVSNQAPSKMKNTIYWCVIISTALFLFRITQDIPIATTINTINP